MDFAGDFGDFRGANAAEKSCRCKEIICFVWYAKEWEIGSDDFGQ